MFRQTSTIAVLVLSSALAEAGEIRPTYPITATLAGNQDFVACSRAQNGDTLTAWRSADAAQTNYLKRVDAKGAVIGATENLPLPANTISVSANKVGGFVVLTSRQNGAYTDLYASVYNRSGALTVAPVRVNDSAHQGSTGIVKVARDGSFAVAWQTWGNFVPQRAYLKRFHSNGVAMTTQKLIVTSGNLSVRGVDTDAAGNVVVGYWATDGSRYDTWAARYSTTSDWMYAPVRVNTYLGQRQWGGALSMNTYGHYAITWAAYNQDGAGFSTYAQLFTPDGSRNGFPVKVSTALSNNETAPGIALFDNNSFAVAWNEDLASKLTIKLRQANYDGTLVGSEMTVSPGLPFVNPWALCADTSGNIAVNWRDYQTVPTARADVYSHDYLADTMPPVTSLQNNQQVSNLSDAAGGWKYFKIDVPAGATTMRLNLTSLVQPSSGNADLYLRYGALPFSNAWDTRTTTVGNNEGLTINNPPPGTFYIGVYGQAAYSSATLGVSWY